MAKQPKEFDSPPSPENSFGTSGQWQDAWEKVATKNNDLMAQHMKNSSIAPGTWSDKPLFNLEEVTTIFSQTMQKLSEQAESKDEMQGKQLVDVQAFLHTTLKHFQKHSVTTQLQHSSSQNQTGEWGDNPFFYLLHQSYLLNVQFLKDATSRINGLDPQTSRKLGLYTRHLVDALSLTTHPLSNVSNLQGALTPSTLVADTNLVRRDIELRFSKEPKKGFNLGENLGMTPGKVVFQNDLFQLIQYESLTKQVAKQPLLIVPPWTNKYYVFDLNAENSFVQWAVSSGLTVFVMSWINPDERHQDKTLTDYVQKGLKVALDQVCQITSEQKVNALGYCAGGTLLACLMAYLEGQKDSRIACATFLATPFDFSKIDELGIYRCEHQQKKLEEYIAMKGYIEGHYMVQAFNLLRTNDLIWSSDVNYYLLGQEFFPFDMLYWICDALRMPVKMHSTYLQNILIQNQLMVPGSLSIQGIPLHLQAISTPLFIMAAHEDHIAPWRSVYPLTQMTKSKAQKFILAGSGHLKGVFNPADSSKYHYWSSDSLPENPDEWLGGAKQHVGSWWNEWRQWLIAYEGGMTLPRTISPNLILEDAPGSYAMT